MIEHLLLLRAQEALYHQYLLILELPLALLLNYPPIVFATLPPNQDVQYLQAQAPLQTQLKDIFGKRLDRLREFPKYL